MMTPSLPTIQQNAQMVPGITNLPPQGMYEGIVLASYSYLLSYEFQNSCLPPRVVFGLAFALNV